MDRKSNNGGVSYRRDAHAVRWYVMMLPAGHRGPATKLEAELKRRERDGEPLFEYFAPSYVEATQRGGKIVKTDKPLLYNYIFVHASEVEIFRIKNNISLCNFLRKIRDDKTEYFPYLTDEAMENFRWVSMAYSNVLPVLAPDPERLVRGDRVRIVNGEFAGAEAFVYASPKAGDKKIMVCIEDSLLVPLMGVKKGDYEVIELSRENRHMYTRLDNDILAAKLHDALRRHHTKSTTSGDIKLANDAALQYGLLKMDSDVMRGRLYSILLPVYTILGDETQMARIVMEMGELLQTISAPQHRALLLVTLYGCTGSKTYGDLSRRIVEPWRSEPDAKKAKRTLVTRVDDYEKWFDDLSART